MDKKLILLVEDDPGHCELIARGIVAIEDEYELLSVPNLASAREVLQTRTPCLAISDYNLPDGVGDALVGMACDRFPVVIMTAFSNERTAVSVIKSGALDFVVKLPETFADLPHIIARTLREWQHIEDRKRAEASLRMSEDRYRRIVQTANEGVWCIDQHSLTAYVNERMANMLGYQTDEMLGRPLTDFLQPDNDHQLQMEDRRQGRSGHFERWYRHSNGELRWLSVNASPMFDRQDNFIGSFAMLTDMTDRKRAEDALKQSEAQLRAVWEYSIDGMRLTDTQGVVLRVNDAYCRLVQKSKKDIEGQMLSVIYEPISRQTILNSYLRRYRERSFASHYENAFVLWNGNTVWFSVTNSLLDPQSHNSPLLSIFRDISEAKRIEATLRASEERFRKLLESIPTVAVQGFHGDGIVFYWNSASEKIYGYSAQEAMGRHLADLVVPPESTASAIAAIKQQSESEAMPKAEELTLKRKDGSRVSVFRSYASLRIPERPVELYCCDVDLSAFKKAEQERLKLERQVLHSQKLESLGVLAGGIAHDFNNLLTIILGNLDMAMMDLPSYSPVISSLQDAMGASRRAADLTRQMLAYSGHGKFNLADINLSEMVEEMTHLLEASISKSVVLDLQLAKNLPPVRADMAQINQVLLNLVINASEAISPNTGSLRIRTDCIACDADLLAQSRIAEKPQPGRFVLLEVTDNGCGMDDSVQQKMFDPFFSTKFAGRGLGMAAVLGVVRGHSGAIMVRSALGRGTTIEVYFPAGESQLLTSTALNKSGLSASSQPGAFSGMALVVDDEERVRKLGERMLARLGFTTLSASDGQDAIDIFRQHRAEIRVVLMDLTMPRMDGVSASRELLSLNADAKVILASGYDAQELSQKFESSGFAGFIQKPYELQKLKTELERIILNK